MRHSVEKPDEAWLELSKTLFWSGYDIWKKRKMLNKRFWKDIAPEEWKKKEQNNKEKKTRKRKHRTNPSQCMDALHFLPKCHDFTKQRPTKCKCSEYHRPAKRTYIRDIRSFSNLFPISPGPFHIEKEFPIERDSKSLSFHSCPTRADLIRAQHDRGKRKHNVLSFCK